ncbi:allophanate hydrolase [Falsiroseomonas sp. HW251]|uniref:allophanate hydrolase n=1 Tax=Falsiroseomonas sp. HW251 TaxID=3390998 RepID=UPI003D313B57
MTTKPALTRAKLHAAYAAGTTTPAELVSLIHRRMAEINDPGIFIHLVPEETARAAAAALPPFDPVRYPLWGLPVAVKDNIDIEGLPTTAACPGFAYVAKASAPAVTALLDAGAVLIGKTNLDQFATGLVGVRTPYPVPRNAFDAARVPGGSSSGSAVAVAQGLATLSLGTDTAGSGRIPAALNNLVGLKPSLGAVSTRGVVPACRTLDTISVFAATVEDAWAGFEVIAAYDERDPQSRSMPAQDIAGAAPIRRIGVPPVPEIDDDAGRAAWDAARARLARLGIAIEEVDLSAFHAVARLLYDGPWVAERAAAVGDFCAAKPGAVHPVTRGIIAGAGRFSAVDAFRGLYLLAELRRRTEPMWDRVDALAVPSAPCFPTLAELEADPIGPNARLGAYTNFVNLLDLAALALPGPFRPDRLPAGITLIAPRGSDARLAALGLRFQEAA